jgi:hypothetical protein
MRGETMTQLIIILPMSRHSRRSTTGTTRSAVKRWRSCGDFGATQRTACS